MAPDCARRELLRLTLAVGLCCVATAASAANPHGPDPAPPDALASPSDLTDGDESGDAAGGEDDLLNLDLERLTQTDVVVTARGEVGLDTVVSTVSRTDTAVRQTPSAVYVVTQDMIRRSGARNLMEVLRRVPGVHVARVNADTWAISIRGFNGAYTDKLLVQIDGRAIYTPLFGGVFWEQQLVPLNTVERIEVVRGPGGSVWGANAVNGVINIVTMDSRDTQGAYAEAGGGTEHRSFSYARAGGRLGNDATYRVYGNQLDDDPGANLGGGYTDTRRGEQGGFRLDWRPSGADTVTVQGDIGAVDIGVGLDSSDVSTGNFLARWTRQVDCDTDWSLQTYYDHYKIDYDPGSQVADVMGQNAFDIDLQRHAVRGSHEFVSGVGFRSYETFVRTQPGQAIDFVPDAANFDIINYFVQDTLTLAEDRLFLTLGCKFEHNDFVNFIYQPSVKMAFTPDLRTSMWASVSRSIRTPSVTNRDVSIVTPIGGGQFLRLTGSRAIAEEQAMTYEIGLRRQPTDRFYWDVAAYFCRYDDLIRTVAVGATPPFVDAGSFNSATADTYGFELWATYESSEWQRWRASYSFYREVFDDRGLPAIDTVNVPGAYPRNMAYLESSTDVTPCLRLDADLRYVDALAAVGGYVEMDARVAWTAGNGMELAVVGQNLLNSSHAEFVDPVGFAATTGVQRGVFGVLSWEY